MAQRQRNGVKGRFVRLSDEVWDRCTAEAEARDVSVSWLVERLVREGIELLSPIDDWRLTRRDP